MGKQTFVPLTAVEIQAFALATVAAKLQIRALLATLGQDGGFLQKGKDFGVARQALEVGIRVIDIAESIFVEAIKIAGENASVPFDDELAGAMPVLSALIGRESVRATDEVVKLSYADILPRPEVGVIAAEEIQEVIGVLFCCQTMAAVFCPERLETGDKLQISESQINKIPINFDDVARDFGRDDAKNVDTDAPLQKPLCVAKSRFACGVSVAVEA